jgi:hypothetical protein
VVAPRSFIRPATAERIKVLKRRGLATTQLLQDPGATVTFVRSGSPVVSNVSLIKIALDSQALDVSGAGNGAIEESTTGTARAWVEDVAAVESDDRFNWQGRVCVVTLVGPVRSGAIDIRFRLLGGST